MARALTASVLALLRHPQAEFVYLIEAEFSGGTLRFTTGTRDLTWNGQTWTAVGGQLEVGEISEDADLRGQGTDLVLSAVDQAIISTLLNNQFRGRPVRIWRAYLWQEENLVDEALDLSGWTGASGVVAGGIDDPFGGLDAWRYTDDTAAAFEVVSRAVTLAAHTRGRGMAVYFRYAGETTPNVLSFDLRDTTAAAQRGGATVGFSDPRTPVVVGIVGSTVVEVFQASRGWFGVSLVTPSVPSPANAHRVRLFASPDVGATGVWDVYLPQLIDDARPPKLASPTSGTVARAGRVVPDPIPVGEYLQLEPYELEETRSRDGGGAVVRTRLASRLAAFAFARGIRANPTSHGHHYAGDTGFQTTFGLADRKIYWGTEAPVEVGGGGNTGGGNDDPNPGWRPPFQPTG